MTCPRCRKKVAKGSANKMKKDGVWIHKRCPTEGLYEYAMRKAGELVADVRARFPLGLRGLSR